MRENGRESEVTLREVIDTIAQDQNKPTGCQQGLKALQPSTVHLQNNNISRYNTDSTHRT